MELTALLKRALKDPRGFGGQPVAIADELLEMIAVFANGDVWTAEDAEHILRYTGADAALICRPFVSAVYGGAEEGVKLYIEKIGAELADAMAMCGAKDVASITRDMIF